MIDKSVFIDEVHTHQNLFSKAKELTHSATKAAGIMLLAAIAALIIANSGVYAGFIELVHTHVGFVIGSQEYTLSIGHIINDILMAIFFLLVGLEIKYEMTAGELTNIKQALLPIVAAFGGVCVPIVIYLAFNFNNPDVISGWGVPTATDIAFALGILALLGSRIPSGIRVFLSTLAVADDIIAILVIAIFYGQSPDFIWLACAAIVMVILIGLNRAHIYALLPYLSLGVALWFCVFMSGVHATIAGVLLAFTIPTGSHVNLKTFSRWSGETIQQAHESYKPDEPVVVQKDYMRNIGNLSNVARQVIPPATRLERKLYPWVYFVILPLFALTNADVSLVGSSLSDFFTNTVLYGVMLGLFVGKPLGIMLFSFLLVKSKMASLPEHVNWRHMFGASILGGVGFTMAIFVASLAFSDLATVTAAKAGILIASTLAGITGFMVLLREANRDAARGVSYLVAGGEAASVQTADKEACELAEILAEEAGDTELVCRLHDASKQDELVEIVATLPQQTEESLWELTRMAIKELYSGNAVVPTRKDDLDK